MIAWRYLALSLKSLSVWTSLCLSVWRSHRTSPQHETRLDSQIGSKTHGLGLSLSAFRGAANFQLSASQGKFLINEAWPVSSSPILLESMAFTLVLPIEAGRTYCFHRSQSKSIVRRRPKTQGFGGTATTLYIVRVQSTSDRGIAR